MRKIWFLLLISSVSYAEIRVYQGKEATPELSAKDYASHTEIKKNDATNEEFNKKLDTYWKQTIDKEIKQDGRIENANLTVYLHSSDISEDMAKQLLKVLELKGKYHMVLEPYVLQSDFGMENMMKPERLGKLATIYEALNDVDIHMDYANDYADAHDITKSMILYTDSTGAVRLYSLAYEVDKLERQLKRQAESNTP